LKQGKIHVLGDALSRAPHVANPDSDLDVSFNTVEIPEFQLDSIIGHYEEDQFFGHIVKAMDGELPSDPVQRSKVEKLLPLFERDGKRLIYEGKLWIPR